MISAPLLQFKPRIYFKLGNIKDDRAGKKIKRAIHKAIWTAFETAIDETIVLGREIVPESKYGNYPPSYSSERMMKDWIIHMEGESRDVSLGKNTLRSSYEVRQIWKASYAKYVDQMTGVNWSKPGSQPDFVKTLHEFMVRELMKHLNINIGGLALGSAIWGGI